VLDYEKKVDLWKTEGIQWVASYGSLAVGGGVRGLERTSENNLGRSNSGNSGKKNPDSSGWGCEERMGRYPDIETKTRSQDVELGSDFSGHIYYRSTLDTELSGDSRHADRDMGCDIARKKKYKKNR